MAGLITQKIGMSRIFRDDGTQVPVTYLRVPPNTIVRLRKKERDGYDAVVLGIEGKKWKTRKGKEHIRYRVEKEFLLTSLDGVEVGKDLTVESIPAESEVTIVGISKGKGFAGVMKRYHFGGGPETHGSHQHREPGSVGMRAMPGKVLKGKRLPGHMGFGRITLKNRPVVVLDIKEQVLAVKGSVPGPDGATVFLVVEAPSPSKK